MSERVGLVRDGAIALIELRRPERHNALDVDMAEALLACCQQAARDDSVRVVVLAGQGKSFGVGGDLNEMHADGPRAARRIIEPLHAALTLLADMDAPVIAKLRGIVAGGSMSLALGCDLAIASDNARFNFAYTGIGTTADVGGSWHLPRLVGLRKAMEIALLNEPIDAEDARALGLVSRVVPDDRLDAELATLAASLAQGPTKAYGRMKRLLRQAGAHRLGEHLAAELASFVECAATEDFREAVDARLAKRAPRFVGS